MKIPTVLSAVVLTALAISSCSLLSPDAPEPMQLAEHRVQTSSGVAQGHSSDQLVSWFDIPFAQPPVGELRWRAPRELQAADQTIIEKPTTSCVQKASQYAGVEGEGIGGSEDCLYLDIKAPADFANKQYPVMFWIHGGGNTTGEKDYYDFSKMVLSKDVVVVTTNYRLGALGFFTHPAIQGAQTGLDGASNFGTLDIIQSLKWVQQNIQQFGGDPNNVTIFGESAGGHNVLALLASPLANGLFHKAISQSGYTTSSPLQDAYNPEGANPLIKRGSWQIVNNMPQAPEQSEANMDGVRSLLKQMDSLEFMALYDSGDLDFDALPLTTADGVVIPKQGMLASLADPAYAKNIPVIAGATKDEIALWIATHRYFMESSYSFTKLLPPLISVKNQALYDMWVRLRSRAWKIRGVDDALTAMESAGYDSLYAYRFDWDHQKKSVFIDFPALFGAAHGTDIAFVTGNYTYGPISSYVYPETAERQQMEDSMMGAWTSFAKTQQPDLGKPVQWQKFTADNPVYLHLDKDALLRLSTETETLDSLLDRMAASAVPTDLERCYMAWETFINVGDPQPQAYAEWKQGRCKNTDMRAEQRAIAVKLIEEHGSISVM
ncbi:MAG: carboxylesterase family protein [Porticoccaceae bacterium]|nr:carboxylesterase family protein [Porticoccaceae bacterium]MBT7374813.1 carboxylesterase family protein [Porticoccaceae bacterium]